MARPAAASDLWSIFRACPRRGREIAIALRQSPATRRVPLVFCDGAPDKVEEIRALLPDAFYCEFSKLRGTLRQALSAPLPSKPRSRWR